MATFKRNGEIHLFRDKFIAGMMANGYDSDFATRCFDQIEGFGTYGFPESHAASFALLVYVSAWIKCFHPDVFACALLNSQPMGFYAPAQLVRDARDHGIEVRPADVNFSNWDCTLEPLDNASKKDGAPPITAVPAKAGIHFSTNSGAEEWVPAFAGTPDSVLGSRRALRLGLRQIKGLAEADAKRLAENRGSGYANAADLWRRSGLGRAALERLAAADALRSLDLDRRRGLWTLKALGETPLPLFAVSDRAHAPHPASGERESGFSISTAALAWKQPRQREHFVQTSPWVPSPRERGEGQGEGPSGYEESETFAAELLPEMPLGEHVVEDYATTGLTIKRHPLAFLRAELAQEGLVAATDLATLPVDRHFAIAGLVLIRQRPGSANGVIFATLEDETGIANLIIWPNVLERFRRAALGATLLYCRGRLQREESVIHIVAEDLKDWTRRLNTLRDRTGDEPPPSRKSPFTLHERIPGYDPREIVIPSRDFR